MSCKKNISRGCCFSRGEQGDSVASATAVAGCNKMETWDWLADLPNPLADEQIYEIQFKNTRKGFYQLSSSMEPLKKGDIVVVESSPGHDVGIVTLTGMMVSKQMRRTGFSAVGAEFKRILRHAGPMDVERWQEAIGLEYGTMIRSREIVSQLGLNMKIGDVEYQGDRLKAIFYYIADQRVDFRELIKVLADQFRIRVEMKQIGARQEAGRIGGISACGRELCCATWQNNFSTVTIGAARHQEISLNPQKLAGQCGKLKCCLNYELDNYIDARRDFPRVTVPLEALDGNYYLVKSDIFRKMMWFSPDPHSTSVMIPLGVDRVRKIMAMNRKGQKVDKVEDETLVVKTEVAEPAYENVVGQDSLTRFDKAERGTRGGSRGGSRSDRGGAERSGRGGRSGRSDRGDRSSSDAAGSSSASTSSATPASSANPASSASGRGERSERNGQGRGGRNRGRGGNANVNASANANANANANAERSGANNGAADGGGQNGGQSAGPNAGSGGGENRNRNRGRDRNRDKNRDNNGGNGGSAV